MKLLGIGRPSPDLCVGRDVDCASISRAAVESGTVLLFGSRQAGKSTILLKMKDLVREAHPNTSTSPLIIQVYVNLLTLSASPDPHEVFTKLIIEARRACLDLGLVSHEQATSDNESAMRATLDHLVIELAKLFSWMQRSDARIHFLLDESSKILNEHFPRGFQDNLFALVYGDHEVSGRVSIVFAGSQELYRFSIDETSPIGSRAASFAIGNLSVAALNELLHKLEYGNDESCRKLANEIHHLTGGQAGLSLRLISKPDELSETDEQALLEVLRTRHSNLLKIWAAAMSSEAKAIQEVIVANGEVAYHDVSKILDELKFDRYLSDRVIEELVFTGLARREGGRLVLVNLIYASFIAAHAQLTIEEIKADADTASTLGLALSGGGFRATLFHLGVIRCLRQAGLLPLVHRITSVSGGSVLAAHLVLNWDKYNGSDGDFDVAAEAIVKFTMSDLRGRVIRSWIMAWITILPRIFAAKNGRWQLTTLLSRSYDRFLKGAALGDLPTWPELHMLCTSMTTGTSCSFDRSGLHLHRDGGALHVDTTTIPVSYAVAASSAFPPLFPPLRVDNEVLMCGKNQFPMTEYLTDGGVFDNLGIEKLLLSQEMSNDLEFMVISDAEGNFDWSPDEPYTSFLSRNIRASDMLMRRVSLFQSGFVWEKRSDVHRVHIGNVISQDQDHSVPDPGTQRALRNVRTDLDAFSSREVHALVAHGYSVTRKVLRDLGIGTEVAPYAWPSMTSMLGTRTSQWTVKEETSSRNRRLRLAAWDDLSSWISIGSLVTFLCVLLLVLVVRPRMQIKELQQQNKVLREASSQHVTYERKLDQFDSLYTLKAFVRPLPRQWRRNNDGTWDESYAGALSAKFDPAGPMKIGDCSGSLFTKRYDPLGQVFIPSSECEQTLRYRWKDGPWRQLGPMVNMRESTVAVH